MTKPYSLVVINEDEEENECVVLSAWVMGDTVYYQFGLNVKKHCKSCAVPSNTWLKYQLIKVKCRGKI